MLGHAAWSPPILVDTSAAILSTILSAGVALEVNQDHTGEKARK